MAERRTTVDGLADAIMDGLKEYAGLATDTVKDAVKDVSKTVKKDIQANAPKRTGRYKKSWTVKKTAESITINPVPKARMRIACLIFFDSYTGLFIFLPSTVSFNFCKV